MIYVIWYMPDICYMVYAWYMLYGICLVYVIWYMYGICYVVHARYMVYGACLGMGWN